MLRNVWLFATLWTVARLLCPWDFPPQGDLPDPGIELISLASSAMAGRFFTTVPPGKPKKWDEDCIRNTEKHWKTEQIRWKRELASQSIRIWKWFRGGYLSRWWNRKILFFYVLTFSHRHTQIKAICRTIIDEKDQNLPKTICNQRHKGGATTGKRGRVKSPAHWLATHKWENNDNCRGSLKRVRGPSSM